MKYLQVPMIICVLTAAMAGALARPLSLAEAVQTALAHNPEIAAADQDIAVVRTKLAQIRAEDRVKVSVDATYLAMSEAPEMRVPAMSLDLSALHLPPLAVNLPSLPLANNHVATGMLNVQMPLYTGGRVEYGLQQVNEAIAVLQARADVKRRDVAFAVTDTYLRAVLAQRVAEVADEAYRTILQHQQQAEALLKQGQVARYEVIRAETEAANQDRRRLDAQNQAALALALLQDLMGTPKEETPTLTTSLKGNETFSLDQEAAMAAAEEASSNRKALQARERMYVAAEKGALAEKKPVVAALATQKLFMNSQPFTAPGSTVGLVAHFPLSDGGAAKAKAAEQSALRARNGSDMTRLENGIRLEVRKYYLDLTSARKALDAADKAVELAKESLRLATRRFEEAQGTGVEKSDAILALSIAETNREQARYQYDVAYYGLQKATGRILAEFLPAEGTNHGGQ